MQKTAARLLVGKTICLQDLHWLPIGYRATFKVLVLTYKSLYSLGPSYLRDRLIPYTPNKSLLSTRESLLHVPEACPMVTWSRAFTVATPLLWDSIPVNI